MPRTVKVERHLEYRFSVDERLELSKELANAYYDHNQIENQLNSIKADYKGRLMAVDAIIENTTRKIRDGFDMRPIDCEVRFHEPEEGWKRVVRLDTVAEVAVERMLPHEKQEILPFVEPAEEAAVEAAVEAATSETTPAVEQEDNFPPAWPAANENGVFEDESQATEYKWVNTKGRSFAIVKCLQLEDGWIGALRVSIGTQDSFDPLVETATRHETEALAIAAQLYCLEGWLYAYAPDDSKADQREKKSLKAWIDEMLEEYEPKDSYPVPDQHGVYDDTNALRLRKDLGKEEYVEFRLLEVDKDSWVGQVDIRVGGYVRVGLPIKDNYEPDQKATVIWGLAQDVERLLEGYADKKGLKGANLLNVQGAITAVKTYATHYSK